MTTLPIYHKPRGHFGRPASNAGVNVMSGTHHAVREFAILLDCRQADVMHVAMELFANLLPQEQNARLAELRTRYQQAAGRAA